MLLLDAASWAPTGGNVQAWTFIVLRESANVRKLKAVSPGMLGEPMAAIVICIDMDRVLKRGGATSPAISPPDGRCYGCSEHHAAGPGVGVGLLSYRLLQPGGGTNTPGSGPLGGSGTDHLSGLPG